MLHDFRLRQLIDGVMSETVRIPFLQLQVNPRKLVEGKFEPSKVVVGQPTLRLRARKDGTWNLQGLIADPWPGPYIVTPPIQIRNGTVELYPCDESRPLLQSMRRPGQRVHQPCPPNRGLPRFAPRKRLPRMRAVRSTAALRFCETSASRSTPAAMARGASNSRVRPAATASSGCTFRLGRLEDGLRRAKRCSVWTGSVGEPPPEGAGCDERPFQALGAQRRCGRPGGQPAYLQPRESAG